MSNRKKPGQPVVKKSSWLDAATQVGVMIAISLVTVAGYQSLSRQSAYSAETPTNGAPGVVVVDTKAVLEAYMEVMKDRIAAGEEFSDQTLQLSGAEFAAEYLGAVKKYRDEGVVVIDRRYVVGIPDGSEITKEIGDALGLVVEVKMDAFSLPLNNAGKQ